MLSCPTATERGEEREIERCEAFEEIVSRYQRQIFNLVYNYVGDYDDAADLAQDVFINAYRAFHTFRGDCKLFTWLCQIATNLCRSHHRKRQREGRYLGPSLNEPFEDDAGDLTPWEMPDETYSPSRHYDRYELQREVRRAIAALPPTHREVVLLRDIEGLSYQEVADATGLPLSVVKTRLHRARVALRRLLEPYVNA